MAKKRSRRGISSRKYRNVPTETRHGRFDSKGEAKYYDELWLRERAGEITNLERQVRIKLDGKIGPVCYDSGRQAAAVIDYAFTDSGGTKRYQDFKGAQTPESRLKYAVLRAQGIQVELVRRR